MVDSELETKIIAYAQVKDIESDSTESGFRREPSFSGWCDEDGVFHSDYQLKDVDSSEEGSDFELPLLQEGGLEAAHGYAKFQQVVMQINGSNNMDIVGTNGMETVNDKYVPFDVEFTSRRELDSNTGSDSTVNHEASPHSFRRVISIADVLKTLSLILVWYTSSTLLTLYNKTLLGDDMGKFPAPLLMNTVHFTMQAILSKAITYFWSHKFPPSPTMSWKDYFLRVVPTALGTALDINLSNASLVFITVTFATMCKSASPIFLLMFAFAFRLESPSVKLLGIMVVISIGILLTVAKETEFEFWGFVFVMLAAVMSGFRWSMTQILLQKEVYGLKNPLTLMSYVTPVMALSTALLSLILDPWDKFNGSTYFNSSWHIMRSCLLMLVGGTLAFFMVLTEYVLVSVTSAVTVTIAGVVKEAVTILVAVFYFHDDFTWLKGIGLIIIMFGVSLFNWYKYQKLQKGKSSEDNIPAKYVILDEMDDRDDGP